MREKIRNFLDFILIIQGWHKCHTDGCEELVPRIETQCPEHYEPPHL